MNTVTITKTNNIPQVQCGQDTLQNEVKLLRSFVISMVGKDEEGEYNPEFVKEILEAAQEQPTESFVDAQSFLQSLKRIKK
jgi:hypothetical protein